MFCSHCGKELADEAVVCVNCGRKIEGHSASTDKANRVSIILCLLCFFFPVVGVIYWAIMRDDDPRQAKICGIIALISAGLSIIFSIISSLLNMVLGTVFAELIYDFVRDLIDQLFPWAANILR